MLAHSRCVLRLRAVQRYSTFRYGSRLCPTCSTVYLPRTARCDIWARGCTGRLGPALILNTTPGSPAFLLGQQEGALVLERKRLRAAARRAKRRRSQAAARRTKRAARGPAACEPPTNAWETRPYKMGTRVVARPQASAARRWAA